MDRAGKHVEQLSDDELDALFTCVAKGTALQQVIGCFLQRDRTTISRAYNVVREFENQGLQNINDNAAQDIAVRASYGATRKYVSDLFSKWRAWGGTQSSAGGSEVHRAMLHRAANRLKERLQPIPPMPSRLYDFDLDGYPTVSAAQDVIDGVKINPIDFDAVAQH